jgi:hypothetical protein
MRTMLTTALATLFVLGTVAACADLPTGSQPEAMHVEAAAKPVRSTTPLGVSIWCDSSYCRAAAFGGSGIGYSFDWVSAAEYFDGNGESYAQPNCYWYGQYVGVSVTVTDSNGATATAHWTVSCVEPL